MPVSERQQATSAAAPEAALPSGYQVLATLPDGSQHARAQSGKEVRLTPRTPALPAPPLGAQHPHLPEVLAVTETLILSAWIDGVPLQELLRRARAAGLATLPPFVAVSLAQQLALGLAHAHAHGGHLPGEPGAQQAVAGFDGRLRLLAWGRPARDVAALTELLAAMLGRPEEELQRLLAAARQGEVTGAAGLEQRLGHWLVKQHQRFPRHDVVAELIHWLCPESGRPAAPEVAAWFVEERNGPVELAAAGAPSRPRPGLVLALLAAVGALVALAAFTPEQDPPLDSPLPPLQPLPAERPRQRPQPSAALEPPQAPVVVAAAPSAPRSSTGVPASITLSSSAHGLHLERAGFEVLGPGPRWAVRPRPARGSFVPSNAAFFAAELDERGQLARLGQTGKGWTRFERPRVRFFVAETGQPPSEGPFGLEVGREVEGGFEEVAALRRPFALSDARTDVEVPRYVLYGLQPLQRYTVLLQKNAAGATPVVLATATIASGSAHVFKLPGFEQPGAPPAQVLLQPGVPVTVAGASRLAFVVPTTAGAPELEARVQVQRAR